MTRNQKIIAAVVAVVVLGAGAYLLFGRKSEVKKIDVSPKTSGPANVGDVSPISGLPCENWNRRPIAVMQSGDTETRPNHGTSEADLVIEMPVITASVTRLMNVYVCGNPEDVGSLRSSRHDFIHIAKGLDAIFVPFGRSLSHSETDKIGLAKGILDRMEIDNMNGNGDAGKNANEYTYRKEKAELEKDRVFKAKTLDMDDTAYAKFSRILEGAKAFNYRLENKFSGYPHQEEAPFEERGGNGGYLRVAFAGPWAVEYDYDKESNSYLRTWGEVADTDRNNGKRIAPKNVAVLIASSEQIEGQYNNVQLGDPWYDATDSGSATYYMNGKESKGTWKKDKSKIDSKLTFLDESGQEIKFVPGQIWVEILEPGQALKWTPGV